MKKLPNDILEKIDSRNLQIDDVFKSELKHKLTIMEGTIMASSANKPSKIMKLSNLFKYNFASLAAVLAVVVVVGGASAVVSSNRTKENVQRQAAIPQNLEGVMSIDEITGIALSDVPGGKITNVELEQEDEGLLYKVEFADGSVRLYDALTGKLVTSAARGNEDNTIKGNQGSVITVQQARDIAQAKRPGKIIKKIELETEHGSLVYSVRFTDGGRVDVNATTGNVIRVEGASDDSSNDSGSDSSTSGKDDETDTDNSGSGSSNDGVDDNSGSGSGHSDGSGDN